jgi:hypothetical protein
VGLGGAPTAGPAQASTALASAGAATGARVPVIVFLKDQPEASGAGRARSEKTALIQAAQAPYLQRLRQLDATGVTSYRLVDAVAATVPAAEVGQLAASPGVAQVIPDSSAGMSASGIFPPASAGAWPTPVTPGLWYALPSETGPYPAGGAPAGTATLSMSAVTQTFDPSVSSPPGDFWQFGAAALAASAAYSLFTINPGQARTIPVTITPSGPAGTVVRGTLYVDDFVDSMQFLSGSQPMALPYTYTIG